MKQDQTDRSTLTRAAAIASVVTALTLLIAKTWAVTQSGSTAMLASLSDTGLDLAASLITFIAVIYAAQPADKEHRFGHGKAEALAAGIQVVLVAVAALLIAGAAIRDLVIGAEQTVIAGPAIIVSVGAIALTLVLIAFQGFVVSRTGSVAIKADALHYRADLLLNLSVVVALGAQIFVKAAWIDPVCGLAIAAWLAHGAWETANEALDHLLDREWDTDRREKLVRIVAEHDEVSNLHDLRTRTSGTVHFAQFHVNMPGETTVDEAHDIIEAIEADLMDVFPDTEIIIHVDPAGHVDEPGNPLREANEFRIIDLEEHRKSLKAA